MKNLLPAFLMLCSSFCNAQFNIEVLTSGYDTNLRGLSVVDKNVIWVCGSNGYVGRTTDGGVTWDFQQLYAYDKAELRDIKAFDENTAYVLSCTGPGVILKTTDGGKSWMDVYRPLNPDAFLDGFDFWDDKTGICYGDPLNGHFIIATTTDGINFTETDTASIPHVDKGTAAFAASGTGIQCMKKGTAFFVTGGEQSLLFLTQDYGKTWHFYETPMQKGYQSSGIYSVLFKDEKNGYIIGGDYTQDKSVTDNFYYTANGGKSWKKSLTMPNGYRSCVEELGVDKLIACGTSGVDIYSIKNKEWLNISTKNFNTVQKLNSGNAVYLAGSDGKVGKITW